MCMPHPAHVALPQVLQSHRKHMAQEVLSVTDSSDKNAEEIAGLNTEKMCISYIASPPPARGAPPFFLWWFRSTEGKMTVENVPQPASSVVRLLHWGSTALYCHTSR